MCLFCLFSFVSNEERRNLLIRCASTAMNSKLIADQQDFFAPLVVDAISCLDPRDLNLELIGVKKINGGSVTVSDSFISCFLMFLFRTLSW
jgi:T-complex protein 1 subunit eta